MQVGDCNPQPPKTPDTLAAAGKWMECSAFVKLLHQINTRSQEWWHKTGSLMQAREVHDSVLACCMITHLPPMRLSMIRSMLYSDPAEACSPCNHPDCRLAACEGNRLYVESMSPVRMRMKFPHHKNDNKWKRAVIEFIVPQDLAELLHMYLQQPRIKLMSSTGSTTDHVFMNLRGKPFDSSSSFSNYWQRFLVIHGAPALNPSICRQIFVLERMSDGAAVGPSDRGAAMVMGHSVKQWHDWYDLKFHSRLAQDAVNSMQDWRRCLLEAEPVRQISQSVQPRRRAQIVYTDSESDSEPTVRQPAIAAAKVVKLNNPALGSVNQPMVISDSDSDIELLL